MRGIVILICIFIVVSFLFIVTKYFAVENEIKRLKSVNTLLIIENKKLKSKILILKNRIKKSESSLRRLYD